MRPRRAVATVGLAAVLTVTGSVAACGADNDLELDERTPTTFDDGPADTGVVEDTIRGATGTIDDGDPGAGDVDGDPPG